MLEHPQSYYSKGILKRDDFYRDFSESVSESKQPVAEVLRLFFNQDARLTFQQKGQFARAVSPNQNLVHAAVVLLHALNWDIAEATRWNIMVEALMCSETDPFVWGLSWTVDDMMNWPRGTTMSGSVEKARKVSAALAS